MAPLSLEGATLGEKHKHYNQLLKEALKNQSPLENINYDDSDVDNLIKIDTANNNKNVDYILDVFKSEDMLYVSRATKNCKWLITDKKYASIINPQYLEEKLIPFMTTQAKNKLLLYIRLNMKDENRVEEFFNHFMNLNYALNNTLKWLPNCSVPFIMKNVEKYANDIEMPLLKRLCEKGSVAVLETFMKKYTKYRKEPVKVTMFLLNTETEKYLDVVDKLESYEKPSYGEKATHVIMKKCPQRVTDNFETYFHQIDLETYAKYIKKEGVKDFLMRYINNDKLSPLYSYNNLKLFVKVMPKEEQFPFLKQMIIDKASNQGGCKPVEFKRCGAFAEKLQCAYSLGQPTSSNIYRWYRFAVFDVAFPEIKKLVRAESHPQERNAMLTVLIYCAGKNIEHIRKLLQYYLEKHVNEPFVFKIQFVNKVLSLKNAYSFDEETWDILNKLFYSLEVYNKSNNGVQSCLKTIIVYKTINKESIPEIVEKKFQFETLSEFQRKVNGEESQLIFDYLHNLLSKKIMAHKITNETQFEEAIQLLKSFQDLLEDWKKELPEFVFFFTRLDELLKEQKTNTWDITKLQTLYDTKKSWRKHMFAYSFALHPSEEACVNALKHNPELLASNRNEIEVLFSNARFSLNDTMSKLRIYWQHTLAQKWIKFFLTKLEEEDDQACILRNLFKLMTHKQLQELVMKHVPQDQKINWSEADKISLRLCKNIAKNMYMARPQPSIDMVLQYAKGDYLQFTLPSLSSILNNMSSTKTREHIPKLLEAPVSLQKHGLRLAFLKLKPDESKKIFLDIWKSTKNRSIRAVLFKSAFDFLCFEKHPSVVEEIWSMLSMFIDNLSQDDNKTIFGLLSKVDKVPKTIRPQFCMKSYNFLKTLPDQTNCEDVVRRADVMHKLDSNFVAKILSEYLTKDFKNQSHDFLDILSEYLMCTEDYSKQTEKYEQTLVPVLKIFFSLWNTEHENVYYARQNLDSLLRMMLSNLQDSVLEKKMNIPVKLFNDILKNIESNLPFESNYVTLRSWRLAYEFIKLLNDKCKTHIDSKEAERDDSNKLRCYREENTKWNDVYLQVTPDFGKICLNILREDSTRYFTCYLWFSEALEKIFDFMSQDIVVRLDTLKYMLGNDDFACSHLLVIKMLPLYLTHDGMKAKREEICKMLALYQSKEVKMNYALKFWDNPECDKINK